MAIEENLNEVVTSLPPELLSNLGPLIFFVKAIGGLVVIYLILYAIDIFIRRKQYKMIKEIRKDVKYLKGKIIKKN